MIVYKFFSLLLKLIDLMCMTNKFKFLVIIALCSFATSTFAQEASSTAKRGGLNEEVCSRITNRVDERVNKYNTYNSETDAQLAKIETRLNEVSAKLKANGADTTTLDAQIKTLIDKKSLLRTDKAAFIAKLTESKQFACGASQGQFKTTIEAARELHKKVMADRRDIKVYIDGTLKPTLQGLKSYRKPATNN